MSGTKKAKLVPLSPVCPEHGFIGKVTRPDGTEEICEFTPLKEGENLAGREYVRTVRAEDGTLDLETLYDGRPPVKADVATRSGPAMVNDDKYRDGWDRIFGDKNRASLN